MELQGVFVNVRHVTVIGAIKNLAQPQQSSFVVWFTNGKEEVFRFQNEPEASRARSELMEQVIQTRA